MSEHWETYSRRWHKLAPPLRPSEGAVAVYRRAIAGVGGRVLLYGVTPELAGLGQELVAIDGSSGMISRVWPGNGPHRHAVQADWLALPLAARSIAAALGDGVLNTFPLGPDAAAFLAELERVLRPGGRVVLRVFCRPEQPERAEALRAAALSGAIESFHVLRWRLAMMASAGRASSDVGAAEVLARFDALFPDRKELAACAGWDRAVFDTIDAAAGSTQVFSFPTLAEILAFVGGRFGEARVMESGRYPLAERCPVIVFGLAPD